MGEPHRREGYKDTMTEESSATEPLNKPKGEGLKRLETGERRTRIADLIKRVGIWNINKSELGRQWGVSDVMIAKDVDWVIGHIKPSSMREISCQLDTAGKKAMNEVLLIIATTSDSELKLKAADTLNKLIKGYTEYAEAFRIKEKEPDKLTVEANMSIHDMIQEARSRCKKKTTTG